MVPAALACIGAHGMGWQDRAGHGMTWVGWDSGLFLLVFNLPAQHHALPCLRAHNRGKQVE